MSKIFINNQKCLELDGLPICCPFMLTVFPEVGLVTSFAFKGLSYVAIWLAVTP